MWEVWWWLIYVGPPLYLRGIKGERMGQVGLSPVNEEVPPPAPCSIVRKGLR